MEISKKELLEQIQHWIESEEDFNKRVLGDDEITFSEKEKLEVYFEGKIRGMKNLKEAIYSHIN